MSATGLWRMTLACGCTWRLECAPDLDRPWLCGFNNHGFQPVMAAERVKIEPQHAD